MKPRRLLLLPLLALYLGWPVVVVAADSEAATKYVPPMRGNPSGRVGGGTRSLGQVNLRLPKVAVGDLTYEERVSDYFRVVSAREKSSLKASARQRDSAMASRADGAIDAKSESEYLEAEGTVSHIERGELRQFTSDIRGEMLKSANYRVVLGKPYIDQKNSQKINDIIARIKQGYYPGADYVLFGSLSSIEFRQEAFPVENTRTVSHTLSLELVVDCSLIDTKTNEVKASFSATGDGQDTRLQSDAGGKVVLSRGKVISEASKALGVDVARQLEEQLSGVRDQGAQQGVNEGNIQEEVTVYK